jgi:hypothetical protein
MGPACAAVATFWDQHINAWLAGEDPMSGTLRRWFDGYDGAWPDHATRKGFPEPYLGDLLGHVTTPRMVFLAFHPGEYVPQFQARDGIFADEIRQRGSYSAWARTQPYLRTPWIREMGRKRSRFYTTHQSFAQRWSEDTAAADNMLIFEAYPWHITTARVRLDPSSDIIEEFVWQPVAEFPVQDIFGFGRTWERLASRTLPLREALGAGGRDYGSSVASRAVRIYELPSGQRLIVEWHPGGVGPPSESEVAVLRKALH